MRSSIHIAAIILPILLLAQLTVAQQRYIVNSYGDVIHLSPGRSAASEIQRQTRARVKITNGVSACTPQIAAGNLPWELTEDSRFLHGHKDVSGVWFETPASGTIDSVYIKTGSESSTQFPNHLTLRIHRSNLYTGHAPGWDKWIAPPRLCWGYYDNTLDTDSGHAAAFAEDATDTTWHSTYQLANANSIYHYGDLVDTTVRSFPPAGEVIWGEYGDLNMPIHNAAITSLDLSTPGRPTVEKGEPIFISLTVPGEHPANYVDLNTDPTRMTISAAGDGIGCPADSWGCEDPRPEARRKFHNFKFYEHPMYCGKPGWVARGDENLFIWYIMTVTGDPPPVFLSFDELGHTLEQTSSRTVQTNIEDCNYITSGPGSGAGVDSAMLIYNVNGSPDNIVYMNHVGGTLYEGSIPGFSCSNSVSYHLEAIDVNGNRTSTRTVTYRTLCLRTSVALADTSSARSYTGNLYSDPARNVIDTSKWFLPANASAGKYKTDDGTAGPYAIGSFPFCGDTMHYAWVGVNGGIALSKTAADTVHLNANGYFSAFRLPAYIHRAGTDTSTEYGLPRNFIAPLWTNLIAFDTSSGGTAYGHVYYKNDANYFIAEWDSTGTFNSSGDVIADEEIFRVVLNKADGSIEYQYDNVGVDGIDSAATVGMQADSTNPDEFHGFILLNSNANPYELKPRNNWMIKLWPFYKLIVTDGWNMISLPGTPLPGCDLTRILFPYANSQAFVYIAGYKPQPTLQEGTAFWIKYTGGQNIGVPIIPYDSADIALAKGWNMVGAVSKPVQTSSVTTTPPDEISGSFFGFNAMYYPTEALVPGKGYWVKASDACMLHINATPVTSPKQTATDDLSKLNAITLRGGNGAQTLYIGDQSLIKRSYELPPAPPAGIFDARFASQQMVETYPTTMQPGKEYRYAINLQSASYPVIVQWNISKQPDGRTLILTDGGSGTIINNPMTGTGSLRITSASIKSLVVKLSESVPALPKEFALGRNYPNPFNPTTRFMVEMPKSADVEVAVYDILGQKIATLLSGQQAAGYHTVEWNGTNSAGLSVPSGTYFIRMVSESYTKVQKAMLMK